MNLYTESKGKRLIARESFEAQGEHIRAGQQLHFEIHDYCTKFANGNPIYEQRAFVYTDLMEGFFLSSEELAKCDFV
jgi:hypothetical protein